MRQCLRLIVALIVSLGINSFALADMGPCEQFVGEYRDISTSRSKQTIGAAISRATAPMGFFVRGVARKRLEEVNPAYATIRITRHGDLLTATFAGQSFVAPMDGRPKRNITADGCPVDVSYRVEGNTLHARYVGRDGEKRFELTAEPGQPTLGVQVTVTSKRLPRPVLYELAYVKAH